MTGAKHENADEPIESVAYHSAVKVGVLSGAVVSFLTIVGILMAFGGERATTLNQVKVNTGRLDAVESQMLLIHTNLAEVKNDLLWIRRALGDPKARSMELK